MMNQWYAIPHFDDNDLFEQNIRAWVNLLWKKWLYTTKERMTYILSINDSVFQPDISFSDDILELFENDYLQKDMQIMKSIPRNHYKEYLTSHDLETQMNIHHIIFQNNILNGHVSYKDNRLLMERWIHSSFHKLLNNKNLYPHEQISRFLKIEADYLDRSFLSRIQKIETSYTKLFNKKPFEVYKDECFSSEFHKRIREK